MRHWTNCAKLWNTTIFSSLPNSIGCVIVTKYILRYIIPCHAHAVYVYCTQKEFINSKYATRLRVVLSFNINPASLISMDMRATASYGLLCNCQSQSHMAHVNIHNCVIHIWLCSGETFNIHNTGPRRDAFCTRFVIHGSTHTQFRKKPRNKSAAQWALHVGWHTNFRIGSKPLLWIYLQTPPIRFTVVILNS